MLLRYITRARLSGPESVRVGAFISTSCPGYHLLDKMDRIEDRWNNVESERNHMAKRLTEMTQKSG